MLCIYVWLRLNTSREHLGSSFPNDLQHTLEKNPHFPHNSIMRLVLQWFLALCLIHLFLSIGYLLLQAIRAKCEVMKCVQDYILLPLYGNLSAMEVCLPLKLDKGWDRLSSCTTQCMPLFCHCPLSISAWLLCQAYPIMWGTCLKLLFCFVFKILEHFQPISVNYHPTFPTMKFPNLKLNGIKLPSAIWLKSFPYWSFASKHY